MPIKIGCDIDGVYANFSDAYAKLLTKHTGIAFPKASDEWPTEWFWERAAGVTKAQEDHVWKHDILPSTKFWQDLAPLPGAKDACYLLNRMAKTGAEVFFITNRPGTATKLQTEKFLYNLGMNYPTVLVAADKVPLVRALQLDFFIDDKVETVIDVAAARKVVANQSIPLVDHLFLRLAPYNRNHPYPANVKKAAGVLEALQATYGPI